MSGNHDPRQQPLTRSAIGGAVLLALPLALAVIGALCVPGWGSLS